MHHIVLPIPSGVLLLSVHNASGGSAVSLDTQHGGEATAAEAPTRWLMTGLLGTAAVCVVSQSSRCVGGAIRRPRTCWPGAP